MIAVSILLVTLVLGAMIALRYVSPAFRSRMELPKYRFQASLASSQQDSAIEPDWATEQGEHRCQESADGN
jgi:hypothetical protein